MESRKRRQERGNGHPAFGPQHSRPDDYCSFVHSQEPTRMLQQILLLPRTNERGTASGHQPPPQGLALPRWAWRRSVSDRPCHILAALGPSRHGWIKVILDASHRWRRRHLAVAQRGASIRGGREVAAHDTEMESVSLGACVDVEPISGQGRKCQTCWQPCRA